MGVRRGRERRRMERDGDFASSMSRMIPEGHGGWSASVVPLIGCILLVACASTSGTIPRVTAMAPEAAYKLLLPGAVAVACEGEFFPSMAPTSADLVSTATTDLLARDEEADAIVQAKIRWSAWSIGLYGRRCLRMEGDVVRSVRTILLPMGGEQHRLHEH